MLRGATCLLVAQTTILAATAFQTMPRAAAAWGGLDRIGHGVAAIRRGGATESKRGGMTMLFNNLFGKPPSRKINYDTLKGLPESWGREAAEYAVAGEVPSHSKDGYAIATFAGGCFWGVELEYQRVPGVIATSVGYTQGETENPTYNDVCSGSTGHTEAVQLIYDPKVANYAQLCELLLSKVDPTIKNRVGNDSGTQYRHGIYCHTDEQLEAAQTVVEAAQPKYSRPIVTEVSKAAVYWPAEEYHQQYLEKGGRFGSAQSAAKGCTDPIRCYG